MVWESRTDRFPNRFLSCFGFRPLAGNGLGKSNQMKPLPNLAFNRANLHRLKVT